MSDYPIKSPRKLIEVALPLDAINVAAAKEKSIRHGHPSTLHLWWARRPLAAVRAVIFGQLVNDPGYQQGGGFKYGKNKKDAAIERKRLFKIIEDLVLWENTANDEVLERARAEIRRSWREVCELNNDHPQAAELFNPDKLPALHDPFAGGGSIPMEAQRLGLEAYASDLNPVAVLINKAMIELPPKFTGRPPIHPTDVSQLSAINSQRHWPRATGLAEDVRHYGAWMREEAQKRIGHLYPPLEITTEMAKKRPDLKPLVGQKLTVIAWIWARTVKSPNPAYSHLEVPLASTFILGGIENTRAYVKPALQAHRFEFHVEIGTPPPEAKNGTKLSRGANFVCLASGTAIEGDYIKAEGAAGRMGSRMIAVIAEGPRGRIYLSPSRSLEEIACSAVPTWKPDLKLPNDLRAFWTPPYGITHYHQLFTPRQLVALTMFSDLVSLAKEKILADSLTANIPNDHECLTRGGTGAEAYAEAICVYLAFGVSRGVNYWSSLTPWSGNFIGQTYGRQGLPMIWDYAEGNPFSSSTGNWEGAIDWITRVIDQVIPARGAGNALQCDAQSQSISKNKIISTDPPYYDNIGYADLSDYFYVWLRRSLKSAFPQLFATVAVPKAEELVAAPYRHGSKSKAEDFFLNGMTKAMQGLADYAHPGMPITIYYAFKQADTDVENGTVSTGWVTFLEAVLRAGLLLTGTWPMRTERDQGLKTGTNSLASSIILVCRKRPADAPSISRREFIRELNGVLPEALDEMTKGSGEERSPVAPVDLSQAIIGPGMAVFSKYAAVLEADGSPMSVRTALKLINRFLAEDDFDADTQFCLHWFEQHNWGEGVFGTADTLARGKGTSVDGIKDAGVIQSGGGKVRLLKWSEYPNDWDPSTDKRTPVWEALHHLIRALKSSDGEGGAGALLAALGGKAEAVRQLAYRLYTLCEREGRAEDARAYNELITSWTGIETAASAAPKRGEQQLPGFEDRS